MVTGVAAGLCIMCEFGFILNSESSDNIMEDKTSYRYWCSDMNIRFCPQAN